MFRVAYGLTFEASYLMFFEEAPNIQDYVFGFNPRAGPSVTARLPKVEKSNRPANAFERTIT